MGARRRCPNVQADLWLHPRSRRNCSAALPSTPFAKNRVAIRIVLKGSLREWNSVPEVTENCFRHFAHLKRRRLRTSPVFRFLTFLVRRYATVQSHHTQQGSPPVRAKRIASIADSASSSDICAMSRIESVTAADESRKCCDLPSNALLTHRM